MEEVNQETLSEMNHTFHHMEMEYHEARNLVLELQRKKRYLEDETNEEEIELLERQIKETQAGLLDQLPVIEESIDDYQR
jgi:hypothetical protein